jgi:archaellum component FlaC
LHKKFEGVLKQQTIHSWLSRRKRYAGVLPFVGDALSFLFGTSTSRDINEINEKYSQLSSLVRNNMQQTVTLKKHLLGLTKVYQSNTEKINKAFKEVAEHINYLENGFKVIYKEFHNLSTKFSIYESLEKRMNEAIISSLISLYNLSLYSHSIEDIEESLIQLRRGLLPSNLLQPDDLRSVLSKIKENVAPLYTLGIDENHLDIYYILPLVKFSLLPNGLMLKLSIPLQTIDTQTQFNILKPISSPIPCIQNFCQWYGRLNTTETFITLSIRDRSWLTDNENKKLLGEVDLSSFSCLTISGENLCYTMNPSLKLSVSACSISLWNWDTNQVKKFCHFEISLKEQYQPIRISDDTWILHKEMIPRYDVICDTSKGSYLMDWAEEVTINTNCYLKYKHYLLYGLLKYRDSRLDLVRSKPLTFIFDEIIPNPIPQKQGMRNYFNNYSIKLFIRI